MRGYRWISAIRAGAIGFASFCSVAGAQTPGGPSRVVADNDGFFIDGTTFRIVPGRAKGDAAKLIEKLGARPLGAGAIVFRSGGRFYIVESPPPAITTSTNPTSSAADEYEERTDRIRIEYVPPKDPAHQKVYEMVKERQALEMLQQIFAPLRLPLDLTIRTVGCDGVPNAFYDRQGKQPIISLCYEYLQELCYQRIQEVMEKIPANLREEGLSPHDVVVGQFLYAALHEMGHAAFDLYDVPVFGREEDAADLFAAYIMLQFRNNQARKLISGAAYSYLEFITAHKDMPDVTVPLRAFSSNHGTPQERFYNILCIAYGSDQVIFADLIEKDFLPQSRAASCKYEFQVLRYAVRNQIKPHIDMEMAERVLDMTWFAEPTERVPSALR